MTELSDLDAVVALQTAIWGREQAVPTHELLIMAQVGGLLLGAYDDGELLGFSLAFAAWRKGEDPWLHSQMLGVREGLRSRGVGFQLKLAQRTEALAMGYQRVTWTFDPLLGANANLNIARLGAIARHYEVNAYGEMPDPLNAGLPSDRLLVEWALDSARVCARLDQGSPSTFDPTQFPQVNHNGGAPDLGRTEPELALRLPADFAAVKAQDMRKARAWRDHTRAALVHYFATGYVVVDFARAEGVNYYLLRRGGDPFAR